MQKDYELKKMAKLSDAELAALMRALINTRIRGEHRKLEKEQGELSFEDKNAK